MSVSNKKMQLVEMLEKKTGLLSAVLKITKSQKNYIADEDADKLLSELDERQKLIDEILRVDSLIDRTYMNQLVEEGDTRVSSLFNEIKTLLKYISEEDKSNIKEAEEKVSEYKNQIKKLKNDKARLNTYTSSAPYSDGIFIDKKK